MRSVKTERFFCTKNRLLKVLKNEFIARKGLAPLPRVFIFENFEGGGMLKPLLRLKFARLSAFFRTFRRLTLPTSKRARVQFWSVCFVRACLTSSVSLMILLLKSSRCRLSILCSRWLNRCCSLLIIAFDVATAHPVSRRHC